MKRTHDDDERMSPDDKRRRGTADGDGDSSLQVPTDSEVRMWEQDPNRGKAILMIPDDDDRRIVQGAFLRVVLAEVSSPE